MHLFSAHLINLNEKTKNDLERARQAMDVRVHSRKSNLTRDNHIRYCMDAMKSKNPWSVERFLSEVSDPEYNQGLFELIDLGIL